MPVLIDLACCVLALQSPPVAEHLVPIPLDGWGAAVTETTVPLPEGGAAEPGALVELARERELRDERVVVVEPGRSVRLPLRGTGGPIRLRPGGTYECSWACGTPAPGTRPAVDLAVRSVRDRRILWERPATGTDPPEGRWRRDHARFTIPGDAGPSLLDGVEFHVRHAGSGTDALHLDNLVLAEVVPDGAGVRTLFDGRTLEGWIGSRGGEQEAFVVRDGAIHCNPGATFGSNLFTEDQYEDFVLHLEFRLPPGGNNGIALRAPLEGDPAYAGLEAQVLDTIHPGYLTIKPWQTHGSIYGVAPARRGFHRPTGQWNRQTIRVAGRNVQVILNGATILDVDLDLAVEAGTLSGREHPGLRRRTGHVGFCGHGDPVSFRNIRLLELAPTDRPLSDRTTP